jgi:hypothetical protein
MKRQQDFKLLPAYTILSETIGMSWFVACPDLSQSSLTRAVQAETLDKKFEKPLRQHLDTYRAIVTVCAIVSTERQP